MAYFLVYVYVVLNIIDLLLKLYTCISKLMWHPVAILNLESVVIITCVCTFSSLVGKK